MRDSKRDFNIGYKKIYIVYRFIILNNRVIILFKVVEIFLIEKFIFLENDC